MSSMYPEGGPGVAPCGERGFSLVASIFLITVLAVLVVFLVTVATTERATATLYVQGARAWAAAWSGQEWAAAQVLGSAPPGAPCPWATTSFTLAAGALDGFTVSVGCSDASYTEGASTYRVYTLSVTAASGSSATGDLASRRLVATVTNAAPP